MAKSDRKEPVEKGAGVLPLRISLCLNGPTKRLVEDLEHVAIECNHARGAMMRAFERWHEDNPDWWPEPQLSRSGEEILRKGEVVPRNLPLPLEMDGLSTATWLYHRGREAAPHVASNVVSSCAREILAHLKSDMPWNHTGRARYRWQAIVSHEDSGVSEVKRTSFRNYSIPVPNNNSKLTWEPGGRFTLQFPLFSKQAGREILSPLVGINMGQFGDGRRRIVKRLVGMCDPDEVWKFRDSEIVYREFQNDRRQRKTKHNGAWFFHLCYFQPRVQLGLNPLNVATLELCDPTSLFPLQVRHQPETGFPKKWVIGNGPLLAREYVRLDALRRRRRERYGLKTSGGKGHGRQRFERDTRPVTIALHNLVSDVVKKAVAEAIRFCKYYDCGTLLYREPSMGQRQHTWFAKHQIPWDWTRMLAQLRHQTEMRGIDLQVLSGPDSGAEPVSVLA